MNIGAALTSQFEAMWAMVRDSVAACEDSVWREDSKPFKAPVRLVCHLVETADFYTDEDPRNFPWAGRGGGDWEGDAARLHGKKGMLAYLDQVASKAAAWIAGTSEDEWQEDHPVSKDVTRLELALYLLRHCQHHASELNSARRFHAQPQGRWR